MKTLKKCRISTQDRRIIKNPLRAPSKTGVLYRSVTFIRYSPTNASHIFHLASIPSASSGDKTKFIRKAPQPRSLCLLQNRLLLQLSERKEIKRKPDSCKSYGVRFSFQSYSRRFVFLISKQRIACHHLVHLLAHVGNDIFVFRRIQDLFYQLGYQYHQIFFRSTCRNGRRT